MKTKNGLLKTAKRYWENEVCETCGGSAIREVAVEVYRHRGGKRYLFQDVPAGVCSDCGARYFTGHTARMMEERMRLTRSGKRRKTITMPVLSLT
ncbi:MAG: hypothetical protein A2268_03920 [Candidatus Raymondbacteria bacterium RifOxyA12_full_50_37]|uniref:YgiT-type zinc finger domain-containing protein n=1 Tax=Candidatus Raymondbacteria bacterium RIFOXYD12_FULL_49_13 TaxID=1817890 RepID=A0A1F7FAR5_UNCRA|nr:MAG: hypothetical protein A2268_03920 [Candidatus Raymondbacteria bacterium RifOxyA12_full_50_37]OGJ92628.1 MAG: hypothetical protein A2248_06030 [Candidatus Raymondbacteria bacterium RIFOXYA2_FULL_49_16]OGJ97982.1 MAG: hypothetical protein A2453_03055 [Candidatus Raymondbacteria bacterium RIFOXYC2_FULL_50_21]OGK00123.1 MAG: hypothetical protein A2350_05840 [Candidatus Raymondbacteria bacterium RifOxyB12_full_50_8]OGK03760.1 MAG: hypothetical protein A2519_02095 [Candidatus Raymondbacteria b